MALEAIEQKIKDKISMAAGLNATVRLDFGDEGVLFLDMTQAPPVVSRDDRDADLTVLCGLDTFQAILDGTQDPNIAFMTGKLKVKGSMGLAMKLNSILED